MNEAYGSIEIKDTYPSIKELIPDSLRARIPAKLIDEITERYTKLGIKYVTDTEWEDGRQMNSCMFTNRIENALEEIVDAAFCILGWILKYTNANKEIPDSAYYALMGIIELYSLLTIEKERDLLA